MSSNFLDFQQPNLNEMSVEDKKHLLNFLVRRRIFVGEASIRNLNEQLSRIHFEYDQLDDRGLTHEQFREAKQRKMMAADDVEFNLDLIERNTRLWREYGRKVEEAIKKEEDNEERENEEMGKEDKQGSGFSMNSEREINNGNLRMVGGAEKRKREDDDDSGRDDSSSDDSSSDDTNEFPYFFNQLLDIIDSNGALEETTDDDERREIWENENVNNMYWESENRINEGIMNGTLRLNEDEREYVKNVKQYYFLWLKHLYPSIYTSPDFADKLP